MWPRYGSVRLWRLRMEISSLKVWLSACVYVIVCVGGGGGVWWGGGGGGGNNDGLFIFSYPTYICYTHTGI